MSGGGCDGCDGCDGLDGLDGRVESAGEAGVRHTRSGAGAASGANARSPSKKHPYPIIPTSSGVTGGKGGKGGPRKKKRRRQASLELKASAVLAGACKDVPAMKVPLGLSRRLKRHQAHGAIWLWRHVMARQGCILADHMGLGKTVQVLALITASLGIGNASLQNGELSSASCIAHEEVSSTTSSGVASGSTSNGTSSSSCSSVPLTSNVDKNSVAQSLEHTPADCNPPSIKKVLVIAPTTVVPN